MSEPKDDGGPAFPGFSYEVGSGNCKTIYGPDGKVLNHFFSTGMSFRDLCALALMPVIYKAPGVTNEQIADECYLMADAMVKARGK